MQSNVKMAAKEKLKRFSSLVQTPQYKFTQWGYIITSYNDNSFTIKKGFFNWEKNGRFSPGFWCLMQDYYLSFIKICIPDFLQHLSELKL